MQQEEKGENKKEYQVVRKATIRMTERGINRSYRRGQKNTNKREGETVEARNQIGTGGKDGDEGEE